MGRMVAVEEWAEIHGKTPATVRRKIHANAWPDAKQATLDGKLVWMLDEDWRSTGPRWIIWKSRRVLWISCAAAIGLSIW